jgi:hypothetical protein
MARGSNSNFCIQPSPPPSLAARRWPRVLSKLFRRLILERLLAAERESCSSSAHTRNWPMLRHPRRASLHSARSAGSSTAKRPFAGSKAALAYLSRYLDVSKGNDRSFSSAAAKAQQSADFLRSFSETTEPQGDSF